LAGRLFTSQEEERRRVAREPHGDITQRLAHLQLQMEKIQNNPPERKEEVVRQMKTLCEETAGLSNSVRTISDRLHPSILEDLGVAEAIKSLVEDFRLREACQRPFGEVTCRNRFRTNLEEFYTASLRKHCAMSPNMLEKLV
jgi:signal transduction histidine kinase